MQKEKDKKGYVLQCSICGKPIEGMARFQAITTKGGGRAHLECYYPEVKTGEEKMKCK